MDCDQAQRQGTLQDDPHMRCEHGVATCVFKDGGEQPRQKYCCLGAAGGETPQFIFNVNANFRYTVEPPPAGE
jgi:hypothetical protein